MLKIRKLKLSEYILYTAIILGGILTDQLSKFIISSCMSLYQSIPLIKGFLHITYTTNPGAAFGMLGEDGSRWIFIVVSAVAIVAFAAFLYLGMAENKLYAVSVSMVVSGGIGNMIDRLGFGFYVSPSGDGEVIDFIDFCGIWDAIFNGAEFELAVKIV